MSADRQKVYCQSGQACLACGLGYTF
jgi:hypothetical protein